MRRFTLLYAAPTLLLLLAVAAPLIRGTETLYLRDVLQAHFGYKTSQTEAWRAGYIPEIDVYRAGGQPLAGNPNTVPFYPDNLLYLVAPVLWALNAHFWLHLLIAPLAAFWLGRAWGLSREASWAVGVCYGFSGFFISQLTFYNLIAGAALAPALAAACLRVQEVWNDPEPEARRRRGGLLAAAGGLWALLVLSGDPFMALLAFFLAASAVWVRAATLRPLQLVRRVPVLPLAAAFTLGTLAAAPQWIEFLRILPLSFRGHFGYGGEAGVLESFDPWQMLEWWLPLCFGRPDRVELASFWGTALYGGFPAYYFSLYPGLLAGALVAASGRLRGERGWRASGWAWGSIGVGIFFALGGFNPAVSWVFEGGLLRFPIKCWLVVSVGASLLCGVGFERVFGQERVGDGGKRRRFGVALWTLFALYAATLAYLLVTRGPATGMLRALIPKRYPDAFVANEQLRWAGLAFFSLLLLLAMAAVFYGLRRRPGVAGALLLFLHAGTQLFFLAPIRATDTILPYITPPPALAHVPEGARVAHGSYLGLFGGDVFEAVETPTTDSYWYTRRTFYELYPTTGPEWRRKYQLNVSPEGLDGFLTEMARSAVVHRTQSDLESLRVLRTWGVEILLLGRELDAEALPLVAETSVALGYGARQWIYRLAGSAPEVLFAGRVESVPDINTTVERLKSADFDLLSTAVIPGDPEVEGVTVEEGAGGSARFVSRGPESFEVEVDARSAGVLVIQRSHLDLWRASVTGETAEGEKLDGAEAEIVAANLQRMGVPLEAGRYRVRFWIDRRPLAWSAVLAVLGVLGLVGLLALPRLRRPRAEPMPG